MKDDISKILYDKDIDFKFLDKTIKARGVYFTYEIFMIKPNKTCSSDGNVRVEVKILGMIGMNTPFDNYPQVIKKKVFGGITEERRKILASAYECYILDPLAHTKNLDEVSSNDVLGRIYLRARENSKRLSIRLV